jgi:hypothetical protein
LGESFHQSFLPWHWGPLGQLIIHRMGQLKESWMHLWTAFRIHTNGKPDSLHSEWGKVQ